MKNIILVIGLTPQGLSVLRTLSRAGYKVFAFYNNKKQVGRYSKYGTKIFYQSISELNLYSQNHRLSSFMLYHIRRDARIYFTRL